MAKQHTLDDEETSVFTVVQPAPLGPAMEPPVMPVTPIVVPPGVQQTPVQYAQPMPPAVMPFAPPSVMPPLYPPYRAASPPYATSGRAVLAGLVLLFFGLIEAVGGAFGAVAASALRAAFNQLLKSEGVRVDGASITSMLTAIFLTMLLLGVLQVLAATGIFGHKRWGRVLGALLALTGTLAGAWLVYRSLPVSAGRDLIGPLLVLIPYSIGLLGLIFARDHFRRRWAAR